ncbi:AAA family ATPase [Vibrio sp. Hal054]
MRLERGLPSITFDKNDSHLSLDALREALEQLDEYAEESDVRVVFIIDEFQECSKAEGGIEIESAIRDRLEKAKAITFVFCGSERALMHQSMTDAKRPLYNHTKMFPLSRIAPEHYKKHFNRLAQSEWGSTLDDQVINKILEYSECHPYYTNVICSDLWLNESLPNLDDVNAVWKEVVDMAEREEKNLILSLSTNDKKVLSAIARGVTEKITSKDACKAMDLAPSSIKRSVDSLVKKDLIEISAAGVHLVISPVIAEIARRYS